MVVSVWFLQKKFLPFFGLFSSKILSRRSRLSQTTRNLALKDGKCHAKNAFFCFFGEKIVTPFSTFANNKRSYPTNSITPDRLR